MKPKRSAIIHHLLVLISTVALMTACQEKEPWQEGLYFLKGEDGVALGSLVYTEDMITTGQRLPSDMKGESLLNIHKYGKYYIPMKINIYRNLGSCTFAHPLSNICFTSEALAEKTREHAFSIEMEDNFRIGLRLLYEPGEVRDIYNAFFSIYRSDTLVAFHYFGSDHGPLRGDTFRLFEDHQRLAAMLDEQFGIRTKSEIGFGPYLLVDTAPLRLLNVWNGRSIPGEFAPLQPGRLDSLIGRSFTYQEQQITFQKVSLDNPDTDFTVPSQQYYVRLQELNGPAARLRLAFASDDGQHLILTNNRFNTASPTDEQLQPSIILPFDSIRFDQN
jgi:hypothetical protein